ncbi:MAG TPA: TIGR00730 family Rossman fold protein [Woeseiaceae bacterium]|nr:TIGR00730 family Rossman fold protein [Woeseiaceae bacterium]
MKAICVYCGSNVGVREDYADAARQLATHLAASGVGIVYGGASKGLMGVLADEALRAGGSVVGVIPVALQAREIAHSGLTELHVVNSMHERKALMAELSDGFVALPGGFGTLEEIVEMLTWAQLQFHAKPCGLLNAAGYFDRLLAWFDHAEGEGFVRPQHRQMLLVASEASELMARFEEYRAPEVQKWAR